MSPLPRGKRPHSSAPPTDLLQLTSLDPGVRAGAAGAISGALFGDDGGGARGDMYAGKEADSMFAGECVLLHAAGYCEPGPLAQVFTQGSLLLIP